MPRAVVIDDNLMFAAMVEPQLKRLGYEVTTLSRPPVDAAEVAALAPALILVNLASERSPGADTVRGLRARPELVNTPLIGYAGHVEQHLLHAGRDAGADLVVPNSAIRAGMPQVLEKLGRRWTGEEEPG